MKLLVTGGTGFLGAHLAHRLQALGHEVTAIGRNQAKGAALAARGIRFVAADLADAAAIKAACQGQEAVFHAGALSAPWGAPAAFYAANVLGTRHIVDGCLQHGVSRLLHLSTPSIYNDYREHLQVREDAPLPARAVNEYARTKRLAESEVQRGFAAGLPVVTIRPRAIFGLGDQALLPRLIEANRRGRVPLINGGRALIDLSYVDNVVDALLLGLTAPERCLGRAYNITNGEPMALHLLLTRLFERLGEPLRTINLPWRVAWGIATALEAVCRLLPGQPEPPLTRFAVGSIGLSQTLDIAAARAELGYAPRISVMEGIERFAQSYRGVRP
ncbi:MAG TPA: NAD-dependent epimerase/dehydratase family protein [Symbiobacteriaceae bacterium]|nr:NAD-dependent epimerase/dehydratase family protein [Symbiobacteriaceae bacterium]